MWKNILVCLDESESSDQRVAVAFALAKKYDAHLTAIHVIPDMAVPVYGEMPVPSDLLESLEKQDQAIADRIKNDFEAAADNAGAGARSEWCCVKGYAPKQIALQARYADLIIVGKSKADDYFSEHRNLPERLVLSAARPLLLIPDSGVKDQFDKQVLVAWNGRRESVRAVNDALPLLRQAVSVNVLAINPTDVETDIATADICRYLARHGVNAEGVEIEAKDADVGAILLEQVNELKTGMLVMGAYGHSRWRELILGGATQHILEHASVPVLMSH